jgi:DNA-binding NtrC family response regulator
MAAVLIVEDDEQVRVLAQSVLQEAGYSVIAATGVDGASALLDQEQQIDVLFIDLGLGNDPEAGLRVAQDAKAKRPELCVVYTTGSGGECRNEGLVCPALLVSSQALHV